MDNITQVSDSVFCKEIVKDGVTLKVIATNMGDGEWQLSILNEKGISSNWMEVFLTAKQAIDAGVEAIENEGVEPFVEVAGFEYLND